MMPSNVWSAKHIWINTEKHGEVVGCLVYFITALLSQHYSYCLSIWLQHNVHPYLYIWITCITTCKAAPLIFIHFLTLRSTRLLCACPGSQDFSTEENNRPFTALKLEKHQMHLTNKSHIGNYCDPITHAHMWLRLDPLLSTARPVTPAV